MTSENELSADLNNILTDFSRLKEFYLREKMLRQKYEGMTRNLQEENKVIQSLEKSERHQLNISREFTLQQENTISDLLAVKSENIKLLNHIKQLEANLADTKTQLIEEKEKWETDQEKIKLSRSQEIEELKLSCEKRVLEAEKEVEDIKAKYHAQYSELSKKLENTESQKSKEINIIIFEYEEKLHKIEGQLNIIEAENRKIRDRAAADVVLYQKKVLALEEQYNNMIEKKDKSLPPPLPSNSTQSFIPGTSRRNSFQYRVPSKIKQSQPLVLPLRSVLKEKSAYKSEPYLSDQENVVPSPDEFSKNEFTDAVEGTDVKHSTAQICTAAPSSSALTVTVSKNESVGDTDVGTTSSLMPKLQFVTEPSDLDTVANMPLNRDPNSITLRKRTRFAAARKRKLFSHCGDNTF